jgi:TIR domain
MQGFISYAHVDHNQFMLLRRHLKAVERAFGIDFWADTRIKPGNYWNATIADAISKAKVHLLLFSSAFIESDYIFDHELPAVRDQKIARNDLVIPLVLHNCYWEPFINALQACPVNEARRLKPVCNWNREEGYHAANKQIADTIQSHFAIKPSNPINWGAS